MNSREEDEILEQLHHKKKGVSEVLNKNNLTDEDLDELFAEI